MIWSHKANIALELDWLKGGVKKAARPDLNSTFYLGAEEYPRQLDALIGYSVGTGGNKPPMKLWIATPFGKKFVMWERNTIVSSAYLFDKYRYAICTEKDIATGKAVGLEVIDLDQQDLAGEVKLPPQVGRYGPRKVLDPTTDLFLCFDLDVSWVVCIDLRAGIDQSKRPWPPPWPHPALGRWQGNDDVMHGRFTQLGNDLPPPRPADYP